MSLFVALILLAQAPRPAAPAKKPAAVKPGPAKPVVSSPAAPGAFPIVTLKVKGNRIYPADAILKLSGLRLGLAADAALFDAAREKIAASGLFQRVAYRYTPSADKRGYDAEIEVDEVEQAYPFKFEELPVADGELAKALQAGDPMFASRLSGTPVALKRYAAILTEYLAKVGKPDPVRAVMVEDAPGQLAILFRPDRDIPTISQVGFTGNKILSSAGLQVTINSVAIGSIYKEPRLRENLDLAVRPLYEAKGYLDVKWKTITAEPARDNKGLDVMVEVEEGPVYEIGDVMFPTAGDGRELSRVAGLRAGDLANMEEVKAAADRMRTSLQKRGFIKSKLEVKRRLVRGQKPGEKNLCHLDFPIVLGPQYTFGKLSIEGLDILNEPQLRKMWAMEKGQAFNGEYPDFFLKQLREGQYFDDLGETKSVVTTDDERLVADVKLVFGKAARRPVSKKRPF